jgi:simple sugar transport system permease protein
MSRVKNNFKQLLAAAKLPALSFLLAFAVGAVLISFSDPKLLKDSANPFMFIINGAREAFNAYLALFQGAIYDVNQVKGNFLEGFYPLSETLVVATPLILTGLSVTLAFRSGLFNIGAQGQFIVGATLTAFLGFRYEFPAIVHVLICLISAFLLAGIFGGLVGFLKARTGAHEVIVTIMLNYVALYFLFWLLSTKPFLREGRQDPISPPINDSAKLPLLFGDKFRISIGILIALLIAYLVSVLLNRTTYGFKFRATGLNSNAATTAGISSLMVMTMVMAVCGGLAGLGGSLSILGGEYALTAGVAGSFGFDAITVALLGRAKPAGTIFAAFLFAMLRAGSRTMQARTQTPIDIVLVIQALIILFIAAPSLVRAIFKIKNVKEVETIQAKGWNG